MGVIQRQSIKYSIVQYIGIAIGAVSMLVIYPRALEVYGLVQALISAASVAAPLTMLGVSVIAVKYFPVFKDQASGHRGFLGLLLLIGLAGVLLFAGVFPFIQDSLVRFFEIQNKPVWYTQFLPVILPLVAFITFAGIFSLYASNFQRIVVPVILEEFLIKLTLPLLILMYVWAQLPIEGVVWGVVGNYALAMTGLAIYVHSLRQFYWKPDFTMLQPKLIREMASFGSYGILNGLGTKAAFYVDTLMVSAMIDLTSTGVYGIGRFIGDTLLKPVKSIVGISQPIIAKAFKDDDMAEVRKIYKKSSLNLLILGVFLFAGIWACIDDVFKIMENSDAVSAGKYVVFFLCLGNLTDMGTSVNNEIINYSRYYRFNFFALLSLALFNVLCNLYFIPRYQIVGAAIATCASLSLFNLLKISFIYWKFRLLPFTSKTPWILVVGLLVYLLAWMIPDTGYSFLNVLLKSGLIGTLYPVIIFKLNISAEYNELIIKFFKRYVPSIARWLKN